MLKKAFILAILLISSSLSFAQCNDELMGIASEQLGDFVYVNDFKVRLREVKKKKDVASMKYSIILNKDVKYRFVIANANEFPGKLVFTLFDNTGKILSSYNPASQKHYKVIDYTSKRTGVHYVDLGFLDGQEGCAILLYSFYQKKVVGEYWK